MKRKLRRSKTSSAFDKALKAQTLAYKADLLKQFYTEEPLLKEIKLTADKKARIRLAEYKLAQYELAKYEEEQGYYIVDNWRSLRRRAVEYLQAEKRFKSNSEDEIYSKMIWILEKDAVEF